MRLQWKSRNLFSLSALVIVNAILAVFTVTSVFYFRQSSFCLTPGCAGGFEIMTGRIRRANANTVQEASTEKSPSSKVKPKKVGSPQVSYEEELNRKTRELFGGVTYRDKRLDLISYRIVPRREFCSNISYVVVIPTMPEDDTVRYQLRSTYGSTKMRTKYRYHVVFVMGRARTPDSQRFLDYESKRHGDILQADFMESYRNLTVKTLAAFRFATAACPGIKAIAKIDVDAGWSVAQMSEIVESLRDDKLYCGEGINVTPVRDLHSKWAVTVQEWSRATYPDYCFGLGYLVPRQAARELLSQMHKLTFLSMEDTFFTGVAREPTNITIVNLEPRMAHFQQWPISKTDVGEIIFNVDDVNRLYWFYIANKDSLEH